jgi:hypothetical protein
LVPDTVLWGALLVPDTVLWGALLVPDTVLWGALLLPDTVLWGALLLPAAHDVTLLLRQAGCKEHKITCRMSCLKSAN